MAGYKNRAGIILSIFKYADQRGLASNLDARAEKMRYDSYGGSTELENPDLYADITLSKGGVIVAKITIPYEIIESGLPFPLIPRIEVDGDVVKIENERNPLGAFAGKYTGPFYMKKTAAQKIASRFEI